MTKIITRFFDDAAKAKAVRDECVIRQQFSPDIIGVYSNADELVAALTTANVEEATAQAYQARMAASGGAVVLVRAGYRPLQVAKTARTVMANMGAVEMGDLTQEVVVKDTEAEVLNVLPGAPLMMTKRLDIVTTDYHQANWPIPLISRRKPADLSISLFPVHGRMAEFAYPLISRGKPFKESLFETHARMANWPIGLLVPGHKFMAKFPFAHIVPGHKYMAKFPFAHIVPGHKFMAKFPFGHIVPGRGSMANWPFPHLLNGQRSTNALIPGGPRMANFPIPLLSGRKPFTGSVFARHARMANFPLGLISRRKPMTASIFPRHARMANFLLPLIIKKKVF